MIDDVNKARAKIKEIAADVLKLRAALYDIPFKDEDSYEAEAEATENTTLAYRHLEDASMRLGKVLQALDGGVSVYDKSTTVGA